MLEFLHKRWFLLALLVVLFAGLKWPSEMQPLAAWLPGDPIVAAVTFIMALPLETRALWAVVTRPGPAWLAAFLNSGIAPPLGWAFSFLLPQELASGVIVATTVPCTLATAAVWTRRAGGNDAIAFLVTMITNLSCFIVVPAWLSLLIGVHADVDFQKIVIGLIKIVVVPIIAAQILRQYRPIGEAATRWKNGLSTLAQTGVLLIVFAGAVQCGQKIQSAETGTDLSAAAVATMIGVVAAIHLLLWAMGFGLSQTLNFTREDAIAVGFSGSQKTLMVGAYLASLVSPLAILPMVAYHASQLVIDTIIADWLRGLK